MNKYFSTSWLRALAVLPVAFLCLTCVDEIDLTQGEQLPDGIVLQGRLNSGEEEADVRVLLERLFRFEESNRPDRVVNARVVLENSEGQTLDLPFREGAYRATIPNGDPSFRVEPGLGFRVTAAIGEERYATEFDVLPQALPVTSAGFSYGEAEFPGNNGLVITDSVIIYEVTAPVRSADGTPTFLRWTLDQTYKITDVPQNGPNRNNPPKACYVNRSVEGSNIRLFNSLESGASAVENFPVGQQRIGGLYAEGNVMSVFQESLSREAFEYFDQIGQIASTEASIFEPPGGPVVGNAFDENGTTQNVFGFFYAANRAFARVPVSPEQAGNPGVVCPLPPSMSPFPPPNFCDDCATLSRSETRKPEWWPF